MKYSLSPNLVLTLTPETQEDQALVSLIEKQNRRAVFAASSTINAGLSFKEGRRETISYQFVPEAPAPRPPAPPSFGDFLNPTPVMLIPEDPNPAKFIAQTSAPPFSLKHPPSIKEGTEIHIQGRKAAVTKVVPIPDPEGFPGLSIEGTFSPPDPQSPEPLRIAVEVEELQAWLAEANAGLKPEVEYRLGEDRAMMNDAFEIRGDKLRSLANRIAAILG